MSLMERDFESRPPSTPASDESEDEIPSRNRKPHSSVYLAEEEIERINSKYPGEIDQTVVGNDQEVTGLDNEVLDGEEEDEEDIDGDVEDEPLCPICMDNLPSQEENAPEVTDPNQMMGRTPCQHCYHYFCIKSWCDKANTCPQCRLKIAYIETLSKGKVVKKHKIKTKKFVREIDESDFILDFDYDFDAASYESSRYPIFPNCCLCDSTTTSESGHATCEACSSSFHLGCLGIMPTGATVWNCPICESQQYQYNIVPAGSPTSRTRRGTRGRRTTRTSRRANAASANTEQIPAFNEGLSLSLSTNRGSVAARTLRDEIRNNRFTELGIEPSPIRRVSHARQGRTSRTMPQAEPDYSAIVDANKRHEESIANQRRLREPVSEESKAWRAFEQVNSNVASSSSSSFPVSHTPGTPGPSNTSVSSRVEKKLKRPTRSLHKPDHITKDSKSPIRSSLHSNQRTIIANMVNNMKSNPQRKQSIPNDVLQPHHSMDLHSINPSIGLSFPTPVPPPEGAPPFPDTYTEHNIPNEDVSTAAEEMELMDTSSTSLTMEALEKHDTISRNGSISMSSNQRLHNFNEGLNYNQKIFIQKLLISDEMKKYKSKYRISSDLYTDINKKVSRVIYKLVIKDNRIINWMNKIIESMERNEVASDQISSFLRNLDDQDDMLKRDEFRKIFQFRIEAMIELELSNNGIM